MGADDTLRDEDGGVAEDCEADDGAGNDDEEDDEDMEIHPLGRKRGGSTAAKKLPETRAGRRRKKGVEDASAGEGSKSRDFWTVEHMIALIRAKRDQDSHLADLAHTTGRMKTKTWKWDDVEKRLVHMGVKSRKAVDCGKKWDNLYQQFKTVHKFMGESGKPNFFTLTHGERKERGFDFRMDERVYSEMAAMTRSDHTIHPTNLADTSATRGVQMPGPREGRNESGGGEGGGDGQDDDQGSTKDSISGGGVGGGSKRKNVRQQTFDTIADVMKEHKSVMASTVDSARKRQCSILTRQCDILEREVEVQKEHYFKSDQANLMMCEALMEIAKAIRMPSRGASARGRKDGGVGNGGETNKGRGHILKSKRQRIDDASSSQTEDFLADEVAMVDAQGTTGVVRLGFGRDGVSREQLQAGRRSVVGGAAGTVPRSPNTTGVVVTAARVAGQISAAAGQGQPRQPLPLQHVLATGGGHMATMQKGDATATASRTAAADHTTKGRVVEGAERVGVDDVGRDDGRRDGKPEANDGDDRPLVPRGKGAPKEDELQEKAKLWVDCDAFWGQGPGKPLREAVGECTDYFVAVANGDAGAEPPSMLIMPPNDVPRFKIDDPAQREPALRRASSVERVVLRTIHGWIFKSQSRWTGFCRAESYITVDFATDLA
ncbi:hypothetical protein CBR_g28780 [Chara braunii]|uniref:Myb/SANT-like DNA-binding domain-containing protein n=1 Tax=Chara braunii TaxID=69332 RepID=A0A388L9V2_CHABU|nr:hypothetical protein CBR_g28780 [Chara braunii]|eukprot:GBG79066.1 hypothetical protein CBR_g28780 [Chara braunii]